MSISKAIAFAHKAHEGVYRNYTGEPYVEHVVRVADKVWLTGRSDVEMYAAALLHDVIEDTPTKAEDLLAAGFTPRTVGLVVTLSRVPDESYEDFILRIMKDPDAVTIKIADITDNLSTLPRGHRLMKRYLKALKVLHGIA